MSSQANDSTVQELRNAVDDRIDTWHADTDPRRTETALHDALGWTAHEYAEFLVNPENIPERPLQAWPPIEVPESAGHAA